MYCNMDRWEFAECAYVHRGKHERFLLMLFILENINFFFIKTGTFKDKLKNNMVFSINMPKVPYFCK